MVAGVAVVALIGVLLRLARLHLPTVALAVRLRPLAGPRFVAGLSVTVGVLYASYCCFTYATVILAPAGATGLVLVAVLFAYGVASTLGNALSGRLVDRFPPGRVLTVLLVVLAANALIGMAVVGTAASLVLVVGSVAWFLIAGVGNGGAAVPIQARLTALAPDAAADALALNGSAISLGGALGSGIGGIALAAGFVPAALLGISALILGATLTVHLLALRVRPVVAA
jgi:predicted MFS family arabinose efflux permease